MWVTIAFLSSEDIWGALWASHTPLQQQDQGGDVAAFTLPPQTLTVMQTLRERLKTTGLQQLIVSWPSLPKLSLLAVPLLMNSYGQNSYAFDFEGEGRNMHWVLTYINSGENVPPQALEKNISIVGNCLLLSHFSHIVSL